MRLDGFMRGSFFFIVVLFALMGCQEPERTVPKVLHGTWSAPDSIYVGRSMVIEENRIAFDDGTGDWTTHPIVGLHSEVAEGEVRYSLDYSVANGAEYRMHFVYYPSAGEIRLAGRFQVVWRREET